MYWIPPERDYIDTFLFIVVVGLDMNISQFLKSLGLEHLRDIFETEQVRSCSQFWVFCMCGVGHTA